jgi:hypothetical protein
MRERKISAALALIGATLLIGLSASAGKPQSLQNADVAKLDRQIRVSSTNAWATTRGLSRSFNAH